ncbi:MAG: L-histidine N(alpha)-methyltransferase [Parvularculaceae bacterium]
MTDLSAPYGPLAFFFDLHPKLGDFHADVIEGLSRSQKALSPKYFYDERGSKIFEQITDLNEYYPTRTEMALMRDNAKSIADAIGPNAAILEYGSGSSDKIRRLLDSLAAPTAYVAMDISRDHLLENTIALAQEGSQPIAAICADFHYPVAIPSNILPASGSWLGYFPGSTVGNMTPQEAQAFLSFASDTLGPDAHFLLGVDLKKDPAVLNAAYNDAAGVTAKFNLNLLMRMRRELDAEIEMDAFEHLAAFNEEKGRIEMHLRACRATKISLDGRAFEFAKNETLHTENSYKYDVQGLRRLFEPTPWRLCELWTDERDWFAACLLSNS